jgi:glycosyltransferase involved in cell wall biosynthesis
MSAALRVALCADFPEEQWPSMDRVANELVAHLRRSHRDAIELTPVCPPFARRATRVMRSGAAFMVDRTLNRWWDYPRHAERIASAYDVFHVVDHSYAQLVHHLPAERTVVTCHDLDTFRSVLRPADEPRSAIFRKGTNRILTGLQQAAWITCDSGTIRDELLGFGLVSPERVSVVPVGVGDVFSASADGSADRTAARLVASKSGAIELLHVGSTIARKRIDALLAICAALVARVPDLHLVRVGGPFTVPQQRMIHDLGLEDRISVVGFLDERTLAAMYRRAALVLLPSEREGVGLPLLEAMACGTPVVASDLPVLREVGGAAVEYCHVNDTDAWVRTASGLIDERRRDPVRWSARQAAGRTRARCFSWSQFAARLADIYATVATINSQVSTLKSQTLTAVDGKPSAVRLHS